METNEAPEKIYIHPDVSGREFLRPWLHKAANNESIEYIRKDAFIEKVCSWMENNLQGIVGGSVYIEDFRKYMGE